MDARRIRDGVDVHAGQIEGGPVRRQLGGGAAGSLDHDERVARVERLDALVAADEPCGTDPCVPAGGVAGLVDAFPDSERGVRLEAVHDRLQQTLAVGRLRRSLPWRQVREVAEPEPAEEPM